MMVGTASWLRQKRTRQQGVTHLDSLQFEPCIDFETPLGEGPVWDEERGVLWFVDILLPAIFSYDPRTGDVERHPMPDAVTSIGLTGDKRLIVSLRRDVCFFTPTNGHLELLATPEPDRLMNRLNDGKVGPDGAFWIGSMHADRPAQPTAALYRVTPDGNCERKIDGLRVSNGLAWSPDHRTMYHADSREPSITAWDFEPASGHISNPQTIAAPTLEEGLPDGAAVDRQGNYWIAGVTGGCIHVYDPEGRLTARHQTPMLAPTMPCFGGHDGRTLFVTGLTRQQDGTVSKGRLYRCRVNVEGVPIARFGSPLGGTSLPAPATRLSPRGRTGKLKGRSSASNS